MLSELSTNRAPTTATPTVWMRTYSESRPMIDGVRIRLCVTVWNKTVATPWQKAASTMADAVRNRRSNDGPNRKSHRITSSAPVRINRNRTSAAAARAIATPIRIRQENRPVRPAPTAGAEAPSETVTEPP